MATRRSKFEFAMSSQDSTGGTLLGSVNFGGSTLRSIGPLLCFIPSTRTWAGKAFSFCPLLASKTMTCSEKLGSERLTQNFPHPWHHTLSPAASTCCSRAAVLTCAGQKRTVCYKESDVSLCLMLSCPAVASRSRTQPRKFLACRKANKSLQPERANLPQRLDRQTTTSLVVCNAQRLHEALRG